MPVCHKKRFHHFFFYSPTITSTTTHHEVGWQDFKKYTVPTNLWEQLFQQICRNSILGVPKENQCVKGGGLLYGGFGLFIFGIFAFCLICILSHLHFVTFVFCLICVLLQLHYVLFAFCYICNLSHLHFVTFAFCRVCILSGLHFVCFWRFVTFAFCQICILSRIPPNVICPVYPPNISGLSY